MGATSERGREPEAIALTWASGFVDVLAYLTVLRVFVANMSGNSIRVGMALAHWRWHPLVRHATALAFFFGGLLTSRLVLRASARAGRAHGASWVFGAIALLLLGFVLVAEPALRGGSVPLRPLWRFALVVALPSLAMGLQNAALTHFGPLTVRTTHVTGTLAQLADSLAEYVVWLRDRTRGRSLRRLARVLRLTPRHASVRRGLVLATVWLAYAAGAATAAIGLARWSLWAVLAPIAIHVAMIGLDMRRPFVTPR